LASLENRRNLTGKPSFTEVDLNPQTSPAQAVPAASPGQAGSADSQTPGGDSALPEPLDQNPAIEGDPSKLQPDRTVHGPQGSLLYFFKTQTPPEVLGDISDEDVLFLTEEVFKAQNNLAPTDTGLLCAPVEADESLGAFIFCRENSAAESPALTLSQTRLLVDEILGLDGTEGETHE
jgi:hypothetical protein